MAELFKLVARRKTIRNRVTTIHNKRSTLESLSQTELDTEKAIILYYKDDLNTFDDLIQNLKFGDPEKLDEMELHKETDICDEYMSKVRECLTVLNRLIVTESRTSHVNAIDAAKSLLKQPTAPLPTFSGDEKEDLMRFLDEFELTISSYKCRDRVLLLLLLQKLSRKATTLLKSLEADKQSYKDAKELLVSAFAFWKLENFHLLNG